MLTFAVHILLVIPARIGSTRLPAKPLVQLAGEPLIRHTVRQALAYSFAGKPVVATDDQRIVDAVAPLGVSGVLTERSHRSGTERVAEVARRPEFASAGVVVNLQCDEPYFPGGAIQVAIDRVGAEEPIITFGCPIDGRARFDPNRVKMTVDDDGRARWFSRAWGLWPSDAGGTSSVRVLQHVGCYVYTRMALLKWVSLGPVPAERQERLEQLRPLVRGMTIGTVELDGPAPPSIDTQEDLDYVESHVALSGG